MWVTVGIIMGFEVGFKSTSLSISIGAHLALVRLFTGVDSEVFFQWTFLIESHSTVVTLIRSFVGVGHSMAIEMIFSEVLFITLFKSAVELAASRSLHLPFQPSCLPLGWITESLKHVPVKVFFGQELLRAVFALTNGVAMVSSFMILSTDPARNF